MKVSTFLIFLPMLLRASSYACDDDVDYSPDDGSAEEEECAESTIAMDTIRNAKLQPIKKQAESLKKNQDRIIFNSTYPQSASNRWRIQRCPDEMHILLWGDFQNGDYVDMNRNIFRGASNCTSYHIPITRGRSVLVTLQNNTGKSHFKIGVTCPTSIMRSMAKQIINCKPVRNYIKDNDERFHSLADTLAISTTPALFHMLNNNNETDLHRCNILKILKQECGGTYNGECSAQSQTTEH